ncbi:MAG: PEP-CTERM sorting domain-containing protein [Bryobacteraceae bacterium]|jgi:hypothetical protein
MTLKSIRLLTLPLMLALPMAADVLQIIGTGSQTYGSDYVFPYYITVNGGTALDMMCDDDRTNVTNDETWDADAYSLTAANIPDLKFASIGSASAVLNDYEMAAWIESGVATGSIGAPDGNAAVWFIFDPTFNTSVDQSNITTILSDAQTAVDANNLNYSGITIYTPTPLDSSQEYITGIVTSSVPEPGSFMLLGTVLLALGFFGRRRFATARNAAAVRD